MLTCKITVCGALGYKFRGDTADTDLNNLLTALVGGTYKFTPTVFSTGAVEFR